MKCITFPSFWTLSVLICLVILEGRSVCSFIGTTGSTTSVSLRSTMADYDLLKKEELMKQKKKLLSLLGPKTYKDPVLADPITKEGIQITSNGGTSYKIQSPTSTYKGSAETYLDLLEPIPDGTSSDVGASSSSSSPLLKVVMRQAVPFIPPNLRGRFSSLMSMDGEDGGEDEYVPMRDLFTSPTVSFAYERGWRQQFATAGFPGPDTEAEMAMDYFAPVVAMASPQTSVVVDMSCATGLFTRRLAASGKYGRVLGCDYSPSMLTEARRRINADPKLSNNNSLDLVRLDVGQIPMRTDSVDALHAGAAMHCWPDLNAAVSEIHRTLKPGGRYFATTFLSTFFKNVAAMDGQAGMSPSQQAFQYFDSVDTLRDLLISGGFDEDKILIEVLGAACVVIRAEK
jgi:SAM-dependent methyltransferase